jgi:hypothetical protein
VLDGLAGRETAAGNCRASALGVVQHALLRNGGIVIACIAGRPAIGSLAVPAEIPFGKDGQLDQALCRGYRDLASVLNSHRVSEWGGDRRGDPRPRNAAV